MSARALPYIELAEGLAVVPVQRGRIVFADEVRRAVEEFKPDCVAVELPRTLGPELFDLIDRLPTIHYLAYRVAAGRALYIAADPGDAMIEAVRIAREWKVAVEFIDVLDGESASEQLLLPDAEIVGTTGLAAYAGPCLDRLEAAATSERDAIVARRVLLLTERYQRLLLVLSFPTAAALRKMKRDGVKPGRLPSEAAPLATEVERVQARDMGLVTFEIPNLLARFNRHREMTVEPFPARKALLRLLSAAAKRYQGAHKRQVSMTEWRALAQYGRNLAVVRGMLLPRLEELVVAAKSCVDDDFGALVLEQALHYPENAEEKDWTDQPDSTGPSGEDEEQPRESSARPRHRSLDLYGEFDGAREKLEPAYPVGQPAELFFNFKRRFSKSDIQRAWEELRKRGLAEFTSGICSHVPEDLRLESFLRHVRQRALERLAESHARVEEFSSSFLDGVDVRETLRNWSTGKVYVRRESPPQGRIGPVVLLWEDDPIATTGLWRTTLYAENQNESDIAISCLPRPGADIVGPGISRLYYRGMLSVFPASYIPDIWRAREIRGSFKTNGELLVLGALMFSAHRFIAVVSAQPVGPALRALASALRIGIVHLPLTAFPSNLMERIRRVHILSDKRVRSWAKQYIEE